MSKKFSTLFIKFLMPYLLIILIMVGITSVAYFVAFGEIEDNALKMQESYMEQSKSVLDRRFKESIDASLQLKQLPIVNSFQIQTFEALDKEYFPAYMLYRELDDVRFVNDIIVDYFIFYKKSGLVVSNDLLNVYDILSEKIFYVKDYDKESYWNSLFEDYYYSEIKPVEKFQLNLMEVNGIPILTTIGFDRKSPKAVVLMILDGDKLKNNMVRFEQTAGGNFLVVNDTGDILISLNEEAGIAEGQQIDLELLEENYVVFKTNSEVTNLTYYLVQSTETIFGRINQMRNTANILSIIILLFGLVTSAVLARYNSKPIHNLMTSHADLTQRVKNQLPYLRMTFLERWLKGNYGNIEELMMLTKYLKVNYIGNYYCVMVVDYDERINILEDLNESNINELEMKGLLVKDLLTRDIFKAEYVHSIDHDKIAVIFVSDETEPERFELFLNKQIRACIALLKTENIEEVHYGVGHVCTDMSEVSMSLTNALEALTTINSNNEYDIVWFDELSEDMDSYYYPPELELKLYNCTRAGDREQTEQILRDLLRRNILEKTLPSNMLKVFIYEIWGTLAKIQEKSVGQDNLVKRIIVEAFEQLDSMSELEKVQYCKKVFLEVCDASVKDKKDKHESMISAINAYIDENYKDPDLCLPMVAEEFKLSYTYLSQIFKDYNNESFINYLQQLRMAEAERLLVTTNMTVKDIVEASGYSSSNTFGKAFKRIHGVSASVYRRNKKMIQ